MYTSLFTLKSIYNR